MYVGLMNAWLAPFYLTSLIAGAVSDAWGYTPMFAAALVAGSVGLALLWRLPEPRSRQLALSSK